MADPGWQAWAPPLDPPTDGGLPADVAQQIADAYWSSDPHLAAALMWEAYAAMLPPSPSVASVSTGAQSVSYSPPVAGGGFGLAAGRAAYHRSLTCSLDTAVLVLAADAVPRGVHARPPCAVRSRGLARAPRSVRA